MKTPVKVLVVEDHAVLRESLARWLLQESGIHVVATAQDGSEALELAKEHEPNVVLLDISMPGASSFSTAVEIRRHSGNIKILYLSAFVQDQFIEQALRVEAMGYVTKDEPPDVLAKAVRTMAEGGVYFLPQVQSRIVVDADGLRLHQASHTRLDALSMREREVLKHLAQGLSKKEIARLMHISAKTVDRHTTNLMAKLDLHNRAQLVRYSIREGIDTL